MPEKKEIDTTTMVSQDLSHWDMSRLESGLPKSSAAKNLMDLMYNQITFEQAQTMSEGMAAQRNRNRMENMKLQRMEEQGLISPNVLAQIQAGGQAQPNAADSIAKLFTNQEFMANFTTLSKDTQDKVINSIVQASMMQNTGGMGGNNMLPILMLMQQNQQKAPPPAETITAKEMVATLTEGIKFGQGNQQGGNSPIQMFEAISKIVTPLQQSNQEAQNQLRARLLILLVRLGF